MFYFFFFFSSRRRHTRWNCDWSSDVCSSDLDLGDDAKSLFDAQQRADVEVLASLRHNGLIRRHDEHDEIDPRSEEHTSELQSQFHLVCRLLLEKKKHIRSTST